MGHVGKTVTQNVVSGSEITDGTVTGADLASDIAISTSGAITTTGAFTSKGIDDNADATAITITSDEAVGIGKSLTPNNYSGYQSLTIGGSDATTGATVDLEDSNGNLEGRINGTNGIVYIEADPNGSTGASKINLDVDGTTRMVIDANGRILASTTGARAVIGRGAYTGVTVDAGSTTSVAGFNGVLFNMVMVSTGGGFGAVYSMAYNSTVNMIHGTGNFSSTSGTGSSTNVYKSSGSHAVTLQNNTSSAVTYYILILTSYD